MVVAALAAFTFPASDRALADDPVTGCKPGDVCSDFYNLSAPLVSRDERVFCQPGGDVEHDAIVELHIGGTDGHGFNFDQDVVWPWFGSWHAFVACVFWPMDTDSFHWMFMLRFR